MSLRGSGQRDDLPPDQFRPGPAGLPQHPAAEGLDVEFTAALNPKHL